MIFQLICWRVSYTFVLASSSRTCEEDLSEVPYFVLNGCQFGCTILCGLVPVCGSAIARRSSRSSQGFSASLLIVWSHPTLAGIKLLTRCSQQSYLLVEVTLRGEGVTQQPENWRSKPPSQMAQKTRTWNSTQA